MILTCPECATSYFVDDDRIPAGGRKVKCASCGARWTATLDDPPVGHADAPFEAATSRTPEIAVEPVADASPGQAFEDLEVAPADPAPPAEPELVARPRRVPAAAPRAAMGPSRSLVLLMGLALLSLLAAGVVLARGAIASAMPATAPVFEALGMKAKTTDLALEGVHSQAAFQGQTPVLTVTGAVRNSGLEAQAAPPIRVRLRDRAGQVVAQRVATPVEAAVPAGATRYFAIILPDPPSTAAGLEVDFTAEPAKTGAAGARH